MTLKRRILVFVDGYNLYHGICDEVKKSKGRDNFLKWVDIGKLAVILVGEPSYEMLGTLYFSAYADHRPTAKGRHRVYVAALKMQGAVVIMGKFKKRKRRCKICGKSFIGHEEKETDVNIAIHMMEACYDRSCNEIFLISGDTDMVGPIKLIKKRFPEITIRILAPPNRGNSELRQIADDFKQITRQHVADSLLPKAVTAGGKTITRPPEYDPPKR